MKHIEIYTDGACSGNPGPGGWGAILRFRTAQKVYEKELSGGEANTTKQSHGDDRPAGGAAPAQGAMRH